MTNFCTLFDSNYLTRGLALHESLGKVCNEFHLYVIAFNDACFQFLQNENLPNLTPISLAEFEDEKLLEIKSTRSPAEYCWTCTPSIILYCLKQFNLTSCTYVDADMIFYHDPQLLLNEMGNKSILITAHNYTPEYDQSLRSGKYCVQFMFFKNNKEGLDALTWWRERCIEWCYARVENGKFGDQKYLDDWPLRFPGVHVAKQPGAGIAPWNIQQYHVISVYGNPAIQLLKENGNHPLIFYHFHGVKFYTNNQVSCCGPAYEIVDQTKEKLYFPYFKKLMELENLITSRITLNVTGAREPAPSKHAVFRQFLLDRLMLMKAGLISPFRLKWLNFSKNHYHYYKLNREHGTIDRP